jgi:type II secretory pathway pseudopilin PulG
MSTAVISADPLTGSTFASAVRVMTVPDGATNGILSHAPSNATTAAKMKIARTALNDRGARMGHATMRFDTAKDITFMRLDGQGEPLAHAADASRLDDGGYVLVALLIGIAIAAVWMAALLPAWKHQTIRERETELVFRGEQYARAILLYSQKMNGAMPSSFDDLVSQHVLRQKWKDPITGDDFLPKVGCAPILPAGGVGAPVRGGGGPQLPPGGVRPGPGGAPIQPGQAVQPGQAPGRPAGPTVPGPAGPPQTQPGRAGGTQAPGVGQPQGGGLCGVQSKSNATSIRVYQGQSQYDLWPFDINTARTQVFANIQKLAGGTGAIPGAGLPAGPGGAQPVGPGGRGAPGRGLQPVGPGRGMGPGSVPPIQGPTTGPGRGR